MYSKTQKASRAPDRHPRRDPAGVDRDDLARLDVAQESRADDVERARLAGDAVAVAEHAEHERAQAVRVAERDELVARHHDRREGAVQARQDVGDRVLDPLGRVGGQQRGDDLRVRGRRKATSRSRSSACSSTALVRLPLCASASSRRSER